MFSNLVANGVLTSNPARFVNFLAEENESGRVLDSYEEQLYLSAASQPLRDYALGSPFSSPSRRKREVRIPRGRGGSDPNSPALKFSNAHYGALKRSKIDGLNRSGTEGSCTLYSFRHTFATRFLERRPGDLLTLAALLGHSGLRMVMRYAHPSDNYKFEAIKSMEEKLAQTR